MKHVFDLLVQQLKKIKIKIANAIKSLILYYHDDGYCVVFAVITSKYSTSYRLKYIVLGGYKN